MRSPVPQDPVAATVLLTVLILHLIFRVPRRSTQVLVAGFRSVLALISSSEGIPATIPSDPRTIVSHFDLDPRTILHLQCPACYALYSYTDGEAGHSIPPDIEKCTFCSTPGSEPCGVPLWTDRHVGNRTIRVPRRKYVHQSLKEWMGRLLARPGMEDILDRPLRRENTTRMADVWDSPVFRNFREEDGTHFFAEHGTEGRFAFSLGADSWHPLHNLEAKQLMSSTAVFLVLLNLPEDQRYKHKNMYLAGVIPGPGKPSLDQINHALILLVKELLEFWRGVYFTRTAKFSDGRFSKGALIPLVCNMLAARQIAGLGSVNSKFFCTFCRLTIQDIENLVKSSWPVRRLYKQLARAKEWKECTSERGQESLFKLHGIRWSALLDLPYWNPILFSVLDQMHAAYLGLYQTHCRRLWGIDLSVEGGDGSILSTHKSPSRPPDAVLEEWLDLIRGNPPNLLERLSAKRTPKRVLWHICFDNDLRYAGAKNVLAKAIVEWVSAFTTSVAGVLMFPPRSDPIHLHKRLHSVVGTATRRTTSEVPGDPAQAIRLLPFSKSTHGR